MNPRAFVEWMNWVNVLFIPLNVFTILTAAVSPIVLQLLGSLWVLLKSHLLCAALTYMVLRKIASFLWAQFPMHSEYTFLIFSILPSVVTVLPPTATCQGQRGGPALPIILIDLLYMQGLEDYDHPD